MSARVRSGAPGRARTRGKAVAHPHAAPAPRPIGCAVITVSDTRGADDDESGDAIAGLLARAGHAVVRRAWVVDDVDAIRAVAQAALAAAPVDVVLITGGTGVAPRDVTPEALAPLVERVLPGFGERFRALSWAQVGSAAWLSRAFAGVAQGRLIVALPGSTRGVGLAMRRLLIPELGHVVRLLGRLQPGE